MYSPVLDAVILTDLLLAVISTTVRGTFMLLSFSTIKLIVALAAAMQVMVNSSPTTTPVGKFSRVAVGTRTVCVCVCGECMYICMYVCMYVCMCVCVCLYFADYADIVVHVPTSFVVFFWLYLFLSCACGQSIAIEKADRQRANIRNFIFNVTSRGSVWGGSRR